MNIRDVLFMRNTGKLLPRASIQDKLLARKLRGGFVPEEKTVDWTPIISVSDALAKPVVDYQCKITAKQTGTGDPSPSNIRPITGWTGAQITRAGKNLAYKKIPGGLSTSGIVITNSSTSIAIAKVKKSVAYVINADGGQNEFYYAFFESEPQLGAESYNSRSYLGTSFTAPIDGYLGFRIPRASEEYQCELGTTATAYTPYETPTVYPVSWQSEAGTVYGGVLDATTGTLTEDVMRFVFDGSEGWRIAATGTNRVFRLNSAFSYGIIRARENKYICNMAILTRQISGIENLGVSYWFFRTTDSTSISGERDLLVGTSTDDVNMTLEEFKAMLANTPIVVVADIQNPITHTLTPAEVALVAGANTLWSDTGDSAMIYLAKK